MKDHKQIWFDFCDRHNVCRQMVPLFDTTADGIVLTKTIGKVRTRKVIKRSAAMESMMRTECAKLVADWRSCEYRFDGLIYVMGVQSESELCPLYIGKAETFGKGNGNISANIKSIDTDTQKFARWGDNYAYHIGDLSAVAVPGHDAKYQTQKYQRWAEALFISHPSDKPVLRQTVFFWTKAWSQHEVGPWAEFGATRLTFLEYLLIGLASSAFGDRVLNSEGNNRGR